MRLVLVSSFLCCVISLFLEGKNACPWNVSIVVIVEAVVQYCDDGGSIYKFDAIKFLPP